jgi:phthiocerol/phenolphthiocerol synthesis type-I polyketide synthase E
MAGRFPGAADLAALWDNLARGVESISRFSAAEMRAAGVDPAHLADPRHVNAGGVLDGADLFDAPLFQMTPREAELLDPQQRVFLECAWAALEDAGYDPARYGHGIGVFAGASLSSYLLWNLLPAGALDTAGTQAVLGNDKDFLTTRVSYKLGLTGPSLDVQTACSTSLVAVILACQSLLNYQCDAALAGGVAVREPQRAGYRYQEGGILSPDGRCRPFDAAARGTVPGNGAGVVVLKRLDDALADGDAIRAVVRGAALNNDGSAKAGFTAPSVTGQAEVVAMALAIAGTPPEEVTFVETHGTATPLGDPIEVRALARAFRGTTAPERSCALGSLKGNLGHLDAAAGIAGFLKAVLALEHGAIPPTLHFERPNPEIDFAGTPFYVNAELVPWETGGLPRRAGVSSFGIGGTNAHVVLEEATPRPEPEPDAGDAGDAGHPELLVLSARTAAALDTLTARLAAHLAARPELPLADVAKTLRLGRRQLACRRAIVTSSAAAAAAALANARSAIHDSPAEPPRVAFLLPGQGARQAMAGELYRAEEAFREEVDACCRALRPHLGFDLRQVLVPGPGGEAAAGERLADTAVAQPALVTFELALARLWESWGVKPAALLGHSLGELVAACLAGVLRRDEVLALVAERGRLMAAMPEGAMLAVPLAEADLLPLLGADLSLAAVNAADRTVASGPPAAIARLAERLAAGGIRARALEVDRAFHSPAVETAAGAWTAALGQALRSTAPGVPAIPYVSNLTGGWASPEQARDPERWREQMRRPVRFAAGVAELLAAPDLVLLEVGPGAGLAALARRAAAARGDRRAIVSSLPDRAGAEAGSAHGHLLAALGRLWLAGVAIDWESVAPARGRRVPLPTYPFERRRYWISARTKRDGAAAAGNGREAPGDRTEGETAGAGSAVWVPLWRQALAPAAPAAGADGAAWLVLTDGSDLGAQLLGRLADRRVGMAPLAPTAAVAGPAFARVSERAYIVDPANDADYDALLAATAGAERPVHAVHLWSLAGDRGAPAHWRGAAVQLAWTWSPPERSSRPASRRRPLGRCSPASAAPSPPSSPAG